MEPWSGVRRENGGSRCMEAGPPRGPSIPEGGSAEEAATPPLDLAGALTRAADDKEFLAEMLEHFMADVPGRRGELEAALEEGDAERLSRRAHSLKGAAATLGAVGIAAAALRLEQAGREGDLSGVNRMLADLDAEVARLEAFLSRPDWMEGG